MLSQIIWSPWDKATPMAHLCLEVTTIAASSLSQPLEGSGLRVIYLAEKVCCQLAGESAPRVPMDP